MVDRKRPKQKLSYEGDKALNYKQIYARKKNNRERILKVCPTVDDGSGIYFFTREENGIKYAYIGQAKHLLTRLAEHLSGYQWIDCSLKKHGLYSTDNPTGYKIEFVYVQERDLDEEERGYIKTYAALGYQLRNVTLGGQDKGKVDIAERKAAKGYRDGIKQGEKNVLKEIKHLFDLHLVVSVKKQGNKAQLKALKKFEDMLNGTEGHKEELEQEG